RLFGPFKVQQHGQPFAFRIASQHAGTKTNPRFARKGECFTAVLFFCFVLNLERSGQFRSAEHLAVERVDEASALATPRGSVRRWSTSGEEPAPFRRRKLGNRHEIVGARISRKAA